MRRAHGSVTARLLLGVACLAVLLPRPAAAQPAWRDLVVTVGGSVEGYSGNFSAVTVAVVDSTEQATAAVGEMGVRGVLALLEEERRGVELSFDGGVRQSAATGFTLRDYAPREWAGSTTLRWTESLGGWGRLSTRLGFRGRAVRDRPPMPLFLQPGYATATGGLGLVTRSFEGVSFDVQLEGEETDYRAPEFVPELDLLDRRSVGVVAGGRWGTTSTVRFFGGVRWSEYPNQGSFDPADPSRRDRTVNVGAEWTWFGDVVFAQLGVEGTVNRSNSSRPEYDAVSLQGLFNVPLPWRMSLNLRGVLTGKSYVQEPAFRLLVPGEEADNASVAYLQLTRPLAENLDGALRFGWTRAETDIGSAYYRRFGTSLQFNYRPTFF